MVTSKARNRVRPGKPGACPFQFSDESLLQIPSLGEASLLSTRERAFYVVTPFLWNSLRIEACQVAYLYTFWQELLF